MKECKGEKSMTANAPANRQMPIASVVRGNHKKINKMAKNDKILIDGIIDDRIELKIPNDKRDEAFEYFSFEQVLKDYDLSSDEIKSGIIDGRNDGGIDGFFIIVNGHFLSDPSTFQWPKTGAILDVWIITCKLHDTFKQAPLDNLAASMTELLDFTIENDKLLGAYSSQLLAQRENLRFAYRKVSPRLTQFTINFCYASRGNTNDFEEGSPILSRANQIAQIAKDYFSSCISEFKILGSSELIELHRKTPNFSIELPFVEKLSRGDRYVLLVNLQDYYNFVTDEGKLRRYLFDSNVRDFMGLNRVNEDIRETLNTVDSTDFWWLNNGVTILATGVTPLGKSVQIEDIQIVNGLQTTESIFRHFEAGGTDPNNRLILVKIVVSNEDKIRDSIIRATNNQTNVELASLHATDKIQRDIEDVLKRNGLYYERRTNFYKNQEISSDKLLTPLYLAAGYVNLVLKSPHQATNLKNRFMRSDSAYRDVFSTNIDLNIWPQVGYIMKKTDTFLETVRPKSAHVGERFLKTNRQFISFLTISKIFGTFNFSLNDLINLDIACFNNDELLLSWKLINAPESEVSIKTVAKKSYLLRLCEKAVNEWGITGIERMEKMLPINLTYHNTKPSPEKGQVTMDFTMKVHELLPQQPWKPGIHKEIVSKLGCTTNEYFDAVKILIDEGLRHNQKDGVVYDEDGNVLAFDTERVDAETLQLLYV